MSNLLIGIGFGFRCVYLVSLALARRKFRGICISAVKESYARPSQGIEKYLAFLRIIVATSI